VNYAKLPGEKQQKKVLIHTLNLPTFNQVIFPDNIAFTIYHWQFSTDRTSKEANTCVLYQITHIPHTVHTIQNDMFIKPLIPQHEPDAFVSVTGVGSAQNIHRKIP